MEVVVGDHDADEVDELDRVVQVEVEALAFKSSARGQRVVDVEGGEFHPGKVGRRGFEAVGGVEGEIWGMARQAGRGHVILSGRGGVGLRS